MSNFIIDFFQIFCINESFTKTVLTNFWHSQIIDCIFFLWKQKTAIVILFYIQQLHIGPTYTQKNKYILHLKVASALTSGCTSSASFDHRLHRQKACSNRRAFRSAKAFKRQNYTRPRISITILNFEHIFSSFTKICFWFQHFFFEKHKFKLSRIHCLWYVVRNTGSNQKQLSNLLST